MNSFGLGKSNAFYSSRVNRLSVLEHPSCRAKQHSYHGNQKRKENYRCKRKEKTEHIIGLKKLHEKHNKWLCGEQWTKIQS